MVKGKQGELKSMPKKTELGKQAEYFIRKWEDVQVAKSNFQVSKDRIMVEMKKAEKYTTSVKDSNGILRRISYDEKETITVKEDK